MTVGAGATTVAVNSSYADSPLVSVAVSLIESRADAHGTVPLNVPVDGSQLSQDGSGWPLDKIAA